MADIAQSKFEEPAMRKDKIVDHPLTGGRLLAWSRGFCSCDRGVVMVEWVALSAAVVIGAVAIAYLIMGGLGAPALSIVNQLTPPAS